MRLRVFTASMILVPSFALVPLMIRSRHGCLLCRMNPLPDSLRHNGGGTISKGYYGGYAALTAAATTTTLDAARRTPSNDAEMDQNNFQRRSAVSTTTTASREYIDDCFGLIGLTGLFVANDVWFTVVFVALSTIALWATRSGLIDVWIPKSFNSRERQRRLVPGLVALATIVLSTLSADVLASLSETPSTWLDRDANAPLIEAVVCAVSVLYGVAPIASKQDNV
jgi:hypothetical protein